MPFRFRKIFSLGKGMRINLSKGGVSTSATSNVIVIVIIGVIVLCLIIFCCIGLLFWNTDTVTSTATPTTAIIDVSTIIIQTANAAIIQTRAASSPTPNITATTLPTLTQPVIPTPITIPTSENPVIVPTNTVIFILPTLPASSGGTCSCNADTYNCGDFSSQSQAQSCFNSCVSSGAGDIHNLDGDGNGLACESLP
jgi:hypothetical protein